MIKVGSRVEFFDTPSNVRIYLPSGSIGTVTRVEMPSVGWQFMSMGLLGTPYYIVKFDRSPFDEDIVAAHEIRELTVLDQLAMET